MEEEQEWSEAKTRRVIARLHKLFDLYEAHTEVDEDGREINKKAMRYYEEGKALQDEFEEFPRELDNPKWFV